MCQAWPPQSGMLILSQTVCPCVCLAPLRLLKHAWLSQLCCHIPQLLLARSADGPLAAVVDACSSRRACRIFIRVGPLFLACHTLTPFGHLSNHQLMVAAQGQLPLVAMPLNVARASVVMQARPPFAALALCCHPTPLLVILRSRPHRFRFLRLSSSPTPGTAKRLRR